MLDVLSGDGLSLTEATKIVPKADGKRISTCTLWRWIRHGIKSRDGKRTRLESARVGGRILVTREALNRFFDAVAHADDEHFERLADIPRSHRKRPSDAQRQAQIDAADKTLREAGILA